MNWQYIGLFSASAFCGLLFAILLGRTALVSFRRLTDWVRNCPIRAVVLAPLVGFLVVYAETKPTPPPTPPTPPLPPVVDDVSVLTAGRYYKMSLADDFGIPVDESVKYTLKAEGLPKGLKLTTEQVKEGTTVVAYNYLLEGVATETIDFTNRAAYVRVTSPDKSQALWPLKMAVVAETPQELPDGAVNVDWSAYPIANLWPDAEDHPQEWSFKGWPAGIKYNNTAKPVTAKQKIDGVSVTVTNALPYEIYGKPTKAGVFTITATHKCKIDGKSVSETFSAVLTVWGSPDETAYGYEGQAYGAAVDETIADAKSVSGLPAGLKFDKATGKVTGMPTKAGVFAVTVTKTDNTKTTSLWKIDPADAPAFGLVMGAAPIVDTKAQIVQGANQSFAVTATDGAKVTASGLPSGLKLVQDKATKAYSVEGFASKPGDYLVTFKTVLNGVTTVTTTAFTVQGNPFAGVYRGGAITKRAADNVQLAMFEVTVAVNGKVSISYNEGKTKYSASAKSFDYDFNSATGTVKSLTFKASSDDKKAGRGDRTAELRLCGHGGLFQEVQVFIDDAFAGTGYGTVKTLDEGVTFPPLQTYVFTNEAGSALATLSVAWDAKKATAAFTGKLFDGTAIKMSVPVCRWACEGDAADYVFAPFQVIAKDKTVYLLGEGSIDWIDGIERRTALAESVNCEKGDKKLAEVVSETGVLTVACDGLDSEIFPFAVVLDNKQAPSAVEIYDVDSQLGEKPLAKVTAKLGKTTGGITITLTSKKDDKAKYVIDLVWQDDCYLAGQVIRTWKDGKESKTAYGVADLSPVAD